MVFWQTLAIINAVWAADGEADAGSLVHLAIVAWCCWELHRSERRRALDPT